MGVADTQYGQNKWDGGLNTNVQIAENELQECVNCDLNNDGVIRPTLSDVKRASGTNIASISGSGNYVYFNQVTTLKRYDISATSTSTLDTIGASSLLDTVRWNKDFNIIMASDKLYKDINGTLSTLGTTAPTVAPTVALAAQKSKSIETFEGKTDWTAVGLTPDDDAVNFKEGTQSVKTVLTAANVLGYMTKAVVIDLTVYADSTVSGDDDLISIDIYINNPQYFEYGQIFFDINTADFKNDMYWKTIPILPVAFDSTLNEDNPETYDNLIRQKQNWERTYAKWLKGKSAAQGGGKRSTVVDPNTGKVKFLGYDPAMADREIQHQIALIQKKIKEKVSPHNDTWTTVKLRKSDFVREGIDLTKTWADVKAIKIAFLGTETASLEVSWDDLKLIGGGSLDSEKYGVAYSYVSKYTLADGSAFYEESTLSPEATITDAERQNLSVSVIADSAETQVTHKNVYIRGGGLEEYHVAGTIEQGTTTLTIDDTELVLVSAPIDDNRNDNLPPTSPTGIAEVNRRLFVSTENKVYFSRSLRPAGFSADAFTSFEDDVKSIMPKSSNLTVTHDDKERIYVNP
ncbi:MAG: hypothetical protein KAR06_08690, partial [Deltaproteobacteria bacterium]|nr:hypothetical protein [Deltaproteobacteria bacterium]